MGEVLSHVPDVLTIYRVGIPSGTLLLSCSDCNDLSISQEFLFGPAFSDSVHMTIELCVEFCDAQGSRMAGLKGGECRA